FICGTPSPSYRPAHLQQLPLHLITDQVRGLPALPTLQVIGGDAVGHLGGVERPFQPQLLGCQQPGLRIQVLDLLLELALPEVNVLQPLAQGGCGVLLGTLSSGSGALAQLLGLIPVALGLLAAGEGPVVLAVVALVPLGGQVLGAAEAGRGQAAGGVGPGFQRRLVHLGGQRGNGHRRRRGLGGQQGPGGRLGPRHGCARPRRVLPSPRQRQQPISSRNLPRGAGKAATAATNQSAGAPRGGVGVAVATGRANGKGAGAVAGWRCHGGAVVVSWRFPSWRRRAGFPRAVAVVTPPCECAGGNKGIKR
uniref:Uncharacterized protein n=1 Tax=Cairina moschata TaxID=8855 RepID=A0A8C3GRA7_CAIMO